MNVRERINTANRKAVVLGWITVSAALILFLFFQFFSGIAPAVLCGGRVSCSFITILVNRIVFYGLILGLVLSLSKCLKLSAFAVLFALLVVESGYRINDSYLDRQYPKDQEEGGAVLATYDAVLGWKMNPNLETIFSSKTNRVKTKVKTNSKGFRDEEHDYRKPQDVKRILLLGDSIIAGLEVEDDQVLNKRLESLLSRNGKYEVINSGVRGYSTDQEYLFLREDGYKYNPDIIIYVFVDNDPWENATIHKPNRKFGKGYFKRVNGELVLDGVPVPQSFEPKEKWLMSDKAVEEVYNKAQASEEDPRRSLSFASTVREEVSRFHSINQVFNSIEYGKIRTLLASRGILDQPLGIQFGWPFQESKPRFVQDYEWDITEGLILKMKQVSDSIHAKFIVYESSPTGSHNTPKTRLETISAKLGVSYFNSFEEMYTASNGTRKFCFPLDLHWNAEGHNFIASDMYKFLLKNGFLN